MGDVIEMLDGDNWAALRLLADAVPELGITGIETILAGRLNDLSASSWRGISDHSANGWQMADDKLRDRFEAMLDATIERAEKEGWIDGGESRQILGERLRRADGRAIRSLDLDCLRGVVRVRC